MKIKKSPGRAGSNPREGAASSSASCGPDPVNTPVGGEPSPANVAAVLSIIWKFHGVLQHFQSNGGGEQAGALLVKLEEEEEDEGAVCSVLGC